MPANFRNPDDDAAEQEKRSPDDEREGEDSPRLPFAPDKDDDSPLGDTDQHSDA